jgi:DNA-binding IclR family transcriptional regulator
VTTPPIDTLESTGDRAESDTTAGLAYSQRVPAVAQAADILLLLARRRNESASLADICRAVGLHKSKGFSILNTLRSYGLVTKDASGKTYSLGPGLLTLSRAMLDGTDLVGAAAPYLTDLAAATGATALLGLVQDRQVIVVARQEPDAAIAVTIRVGHRYDLTWGAHGRAIVAFLPAKRREAVLQDDTLSFDGARDQGPASKPPDRAALRRELDEVVRLGYAVDLGRVQAGVSAIAAPVLAGSENDRDPGSPVACVIVVGTFGPEQVAAYGARVAATAQTMSADLRSLLDHHR